MPDIPRHVELVEEDLRLRPPRRAETGLFARWWDDEEVAFGFCSEPRIEAELDAAFPELEAEAADIGHWIDFVMEIEGQAVGLIWLSRWDLDAATCELNILIGEREFRGRGLARRAIRLLCAWAFPTMALSRIDLFPRDDHIPAIRSYRGAGASMGEVSQDVVTWRGETICFRQLYFKPSDFSP